MGKTSRGRGVILRLQEGRPLSEEYWLLHAQFTEDNMRRVIDMPWTERMRLSVDLGAAIGLELDRAYGVQLVGESFVWTGGSRVQWKVFVPAALAERMKETPWYI